MELKNYEIAALKRTAANMDKMQTELNKKLAKKAQLESEIEALQASLGNMEAPYMQMTGGRHIMDLIHKTVTPLVNEDGTPKMDKEGKYQQKVTKFVFVDPDKVEETTYAEVATAQAEEALNQEVNNVEE